MKPVLACSDLRSGYGSIEVLKGVWLEVFPGDIYALMGKNGAGKTTLLQTLLGVIRRTAGTVSILGKDLGDKPTHQIVATGVTCAPQERAFFNDLTVEENLRLGSLSLDASLFARGKERVVEMFPFLGNRMRQKAGTLSGGEQAMLKVARALLPEPKLVLLDEVTEGLQPLTVDRVRAVLTQDHGQRATTMLIVEQNLDFVAGFATRFGLMERGEIRAEGDFTEDGAVAEIGSHLSI